MARPLLFYSAWPLEYHNLEAIRKARGFAARGYDTVYVAGIGIRNPRVTTLAKAADRLRRKLTEGRRPPAGEDTGVRTASLVVLPPRQLPPLRRFNDAWVARQLRAAVAP